MVLEVGFEPMPTYMDQKLRLQSSIMTIKHIPFSPLVPGEIVCVEQLPRQNSGPKWKLAKVAKHINNWLYWRMTGVDQKACKKVCATRHKEMSRWNETGL